MSHGGKWIVSIQYWNFGPFDSQEDADEFASAQGGQAWPLWDPAGLEPLRVQQREEETFGSGRPE